MKGFLFVSIFSEDEFYDVLLDFEFERFLSRLEVVIVCFFEEEGEYLGSRKYRMFEEKDCGGGDVFFNGIKKYRISLFFFMFFRNDFSIWSIFRKCIGMELFKIMMLVIFNEFLSFL